ncbi:MULTISPECIES: NUDIX domain-containing protein [unclassified Legionella]|uniref:NUDIX domain-containing protein n=1 Tax=unclassified Legionella TaxID=2622702 RepID=UPI0010545BC4|nr:MULTISPECIES: NUDIX hydrolase [unclassified Legionella]MDI9818416.1 NUDIX hydrolase [Legionella sp. PL877]
MGRKGTRNIRVVKPENAGDRPQLTSCIILTFDKRILLQKRPDNWRTYPGYVCCFGGHVEEGEHPLQAICRELQEELGANAVETDVTPLSCYSESVTNFKEIVHGFFWHDKGDTISDCYEAETYYLNHISELNNVPLVMDDVPWLIECSREKGLLPDNVT